MGGGGGLEATYNDHLRLIGKRVVDFLLVLIELFSQGVTAKALRTNVGSKSANSLQKGAVGPIFQVEGVAPPTILVFRQDVQLRRRETALQGAL